MVNPHVSDVREAEIVVRGAGFKAGSATVLNHSDIHAHNTFEDRRVVVPETKSLDVAGPGLRYMFAPASVTKLALTLT